MELQDPQQQTDWYKKTNEIEGIWYIDRRLSYKTQIRDKEWGGGGALDWMYADKTDLDSVWSIKRITWWTIKQGWNNYTQSTYGITVSKWGIYLTGLYAELGYSQSTYLRMYVRNRTLSKYAFDIKIADQSYNYDASWIIRANDWDEFEVRVECGTTLNYPELFRRWMVKVW